MTLQETTRLLAPIAVAFRADMDDPSYRAYAAVLKDVPLPLAGKALERLIDEGARFLPSAPEIRTAAEKVRRQLLALHPYEGCAECEHQIGYRTVLNGAGQPTVEPCPCKARHLERLAMMGLREPVAQLPGEAARESEQVYPTLEQLPARIRQQLTAVIERKALE